MTDEEYDALDEELTRTIPKLGSNSNDWLTQRELRSMGLNKLSTDYLLTKAMATRQTPAQVIDELIREKVAASF
jgi:surfactin synthase thioesterase subunit